QGLLDGGLKLRALHIPDRFFEHDAPEVQCAKAGIDAQAITTAVLDALKLETSATIDAGALKA
ncbi:MAG TPA: hypothetical protein DCQ35_00780, partial [Rhodospirillum rubrum]|nr:hypothetical protein [Rhodospirillum rubrum]